MIHAGIDDALDQVEAMDRHVEKMEHLLGTETPGKVHWVRGSLLGLSFMHLWGVALGSESGSWTREADGLTSVDRHEVAHWTIDSHVQLYQAPRPIILAEGWAETQSGYPRLEIFSRAAKCREEGSWLPLQELILPGRKDYNYAEFNARSYYQGRVLVDFLLSQYGGPAFFAFYRQIANLLARCWRCDSGREAITSHSQIRTSFLRRASPGRHFPLARDLRPGAPPHRRQSHNTAPRVIFGRNRRKSRRAEQ